MPESLPWLESLIEFCVIFAATYGVFVALYFLVGFFFDWLNAKHPDRRIQKNRRGEERRWQEMRSSVLSLFVTCFCLVFGIFAQRQGWTIAPVAIWSWWSIPLLVLSIVLFDGWFYFAHRLMHTKVLYPYHLEHHRSVAPTVWSNYSDNPVDAFAQQSYFLFVMFFVPIPWQLLALQRIYDHFNGMIGHSGFEYFAGRMARWPSVLVCTVFHDQHHSAFNYNFSNFFSFWDRVLGTLHPRYDEMVEVFETPEGRKTADTAKIVK